MEGFTTADDDGVGGGVEDVDADDADEEGVVVELGCEECLCSGSMTRSGLRTGSGSRSLSGVFRFEGEDNCTFFLVDEEDEGDDDAASPFLLKIFAPFRISRS